MKLSEKILYYRKAAKLSQEELAAQVGVSRQAVSKWELGESTPEVDKLLALARAFGVTTDELLSDSEPAGFQEPAEPPQEEPPAYSAPETGGFEKATGWIGRLIQRYGWLFGVRVALSGLGITLVGAFARWGFGAMFSTSNQIMGGMGGLGGYGGVIYDGPPELRDEILGQLGLGASASPLGGIESFFLGFATVILVLGMLTMIAGVVLALVLYQKGNRKS